MIKRATLPLLLAIFLLTGAFIPAYYASERGFEQITLTGTGSAGAATGSVTTSNRFVGEITAIYIDYAAGISNTTDITVATLSPVLNLMVKSNSATDAWYHPVVQQTNNTGAGTSTYAPVPVYDRLKITGGDSTSGTIATLTIYYRN